MLPHSAGNGVSEVLLGKPGTDTTKTKKEFIVSSMQLIKSQFEQNSIKKRDHKEKKKAVEPITTRLDSIEWMNRVIR